MKSVVFQVSEEDVGRLGIEADDVGRWCVLVSGVTHFKESEAEARDLHKVVCAGVDQPNITVPVREHED